MNKPSDMFLLAIFGLSLLSYVSHGQTHTLLLVRGSNSINDFTSIRTWPGISLLYPDEYHNYSQLQDELSQIATTAPRIVDLFTIGTSYQGKDIQCLRFTNEEKTGQKPMVLFVAHHHAREQITVETALRFMLRLINWYGVDEAITHYINSEEIYVIPSLNPDGLQYVVDEGNAWLRKNLRPIDDDRDGQVDEDRATDENGDGIISEFDIYVKKGNFWLYEGYYLEGIDDDGDGLINEDDIGGIDLNRNYAYRWNDSLLDSGSGSDTTKEDYPGTAPFSEPETQALRDFVENKTFSIAMSLHSGINATYFPWSSENEFWAESFLYYQIYNDFLQLWPNLHDFLNVPQTSAEEIQKKALPTTTAGEWSDWMYAERNCHVPMTFEIYKNASSITQGQLLESNDTHQIWRWDEIFGYFAPVEAAINDLWRELLPTLDYWLNIAPRIEIESASFSNGKLKLNVTNLSPRVSTVTVLKILDNNFDPVLHEGKSVAMRTIPAGKTANATIEVDKTGFTALRIGNAFVGYQTVQFEKKSESSSWSFWVTLFAIPLMIAWFKARKRKLNQQRFHR
ncbi:MAG: M14 family zinc carboxypeptidase [Candidatus Heimdallarchaeota archaeon]